MVLIYLSIVVGFRSMGGKKWDFWGEDFFGEKLAGGMGRGMAIFGGVGGARSKVAGFISQNWCN